MDREQVRGLLAKKFAEPVVVIPPEERLKKLLEEFDIYAGHMHSDGIPFEVGDLVTPREGTVMTAAGEPHIVLEIYEEDDPHWSEIGRGTMADGTMPNMRVGVWTGDHLLAFWVESWMFEAWRPAGEAAKQ